MTSVTCASCEAMLTVDLVPTTLPDQYAGDGQPLLPPGTYAIDPDPVVKTVWTRGEGTERIEDIPGGNIVVRPDDIQAGALDPVRGRDAGCCGLDGCDGPNQRCKCGEIVALARTDCWTAHEVRFLPNQARISS